MATRQKVTLACNNCRRRKAKCDSNVPTCSPCRSREDTSCTYEGLMDHRKTRQWATRPLLGSQGGLRKSRPHRVSPLSASSLPLTSSSSYPDSGSTNQREEIGQARTTILSEIIEPGTASSMSAEVNHSPAYSNRASTHTETGTPFVEASPMSAEFFGERSASSFVRQINSAIDIRLGQQQQVPLRGRDDNALRPISRQTDTSAVWQHQLQDPESYTLPSRKLAESLLQAYHDLVWATFPIHDMTVFREAYKAAWLGNSAAIPERTLHCLLNLCFALGAQFSEIIEPPARKELSQTYWARASRLFGVPLDDEASIERVQCMLLMCLYLQSTCELYESWMVLGSAIRMAQSLSLHIRTTQFLDRQEREIARKTWHGCIYQDRVLSMIFSRPSMLTRGFPLAVPLPIMVDDEFLNTGSLPSTVRPDGKITIVAFWIKSLELFDIIDDIQHETYQNTDGNKVKDIHYLRSVLDFDNRLDDWAHSLPAHLQYTKDHQDCGLLLRRQCVVQHARYLYARISALRPVLADLYLKQGSTHESEPPRIVDQVLSHALITECAMTCVRVAHEMIDVLYSNFDFETVSGPVPAWWSGVLFTYTAATVLLVEKLKMTDRRHSRPTMPCSGAEVDDWERAMQLLRAYTRVSQSAQRCVAALEILRNKVLSTTAQCGPNLGQEQTPDQCGPASAVNEMRGLDDVTDEISTSAEFVDVNFDIDDAFWLNAPNYGFSLFRDPKYHQ